MLCSLAWRDNDLNSETIWITFWPRRCAYAIFCALFSTLRIKHEAQPENLSSDKKRASLHDSWWLFEIFIALMNTSNVNLSGLRQVNWTEQRKKRSLKECVFPSGAQTVAKQITTQYKKVATVSRHHDTFERTHGTLVSSHLTSPKQDTAEDNSSLWKTLTQHIRLIGRNTPVRRRWNYYFD